MVERLRGIPVFLCFIWVMLAIARPAQAGYAHIIYDASNGEVLAAENADTINHPASLTKMMTLYMAFEALKSGHLKWDQQIVMTANAASKIPFKLGVKAGHKLTVREAIYGMAIRSANDAAAAIADHLGGSEERFGVLMTQRARRLGMRRTVFRNASGLPDDRQVTTARDMAVLALALIRDFPREYKLFSKRSFRFRGKAIHGHNNLMYRYPGMDGIKTGYIRASGFNIASAVHVDGRRIIGVVMGGKTARKRDDRMAELLDRYVSESDDKIGGILSFVKPRPAKEITLGSSGGAPAARASAVSLPSGAPVPQERLGPIWRIQISAAGTRKAASAILEKALSLLPADMGRIAPSVEGYAKNGTEFFRARLVGFDDRDAASRACSVLEAKSMKCYVVR